MMDVATNLRILVIDDNPAIHQDFIKILKTNTSKSKLDTLGDELFGTDAQAQEQESPLPLFVIDTATQGQEGVERIKQALDAGQPYAVAFVDVRMPPGWDGIETIKHIWALDTDIQIVICTAYSDYTWEETAHELGMTDNLLILKKPFDNVAVRQLAYALTKKWQLMQDSRRHTDYLEKTVQERTSSLQQSLSVIRSTMESSYDGIVVVDNENKIVDFNKHFIDMWGIPDAFIDAKDYIPIESHITKQLQKADDYVELVGKLKTASNEIMLDMLRLKDGRVFEFYSQPHTLQGVTAGRVWSFRDISKRIYLEKKLEHQATHDSLTDLPNRALLIDRIQKEIAIATRSSSKFAVIFFDLDRFKLVNDSLGHKAGDEVLLTVTKRLRVTIRGEDTLARLGGDEFVIVSRKLQKRDDAITVTSKVLETIKTPMRIVDRELMMSASMGISIYPDDGETVDELLRNADLAMYRAKEMGRGRTQFYTEDLNIQSKSRLEHEIELRHALVNNEFFLEYQPQFDRIAGQDENKLAAVEALIRWQHPTRGLLLPIDFIPLAEETGLIVTLGEWVLRTVCKQNKAWQDQGLTPIRVIVNVATQQFKEPNFVGLVTNILSETGLKPEYLEIEVTENVVVNNEEVIVCIKELKDMGIQIVLDNFGTGNSGLNYLKKIPINRLKIDRSFIRNIDSSRSDEVIIQAIIAMANSLNLDVIAEGVESKEQMDFLEAQKCWEFQGFFFSHPLVVSELEALMKKSQTS